MTSTVLSPKRILDAQFLLTWLRAENHLGALETGLGWPMRTQDLEMEQHLDQDLATHRPAGMAVYGPIQPSVAVSRVGRTTVAGCLVTTILAEVLG